MSHIWLCQHAMKLLSIVSMQCSCCSVVTRSMHALNMLVWDDWPYACSQGSVGPWLIKVSVHPCMTVTVLHALQAGYSAFVFALRDDFLFNNGPGFLC